MAQVELSQASGLPACKSEGTKLTIPDGGINYTSLTIGAFANREIHFLETLLRNAADINLPPAAQKDARDLTALLERVSSPANIGKMTDLELSDTGTKIWSLEKKVSGAYMALIEKQIRTLASKETDQEIKVVMIEYADLAKAIGTNLAAQLDSIPMNLTDQKLSNILRAHDYAQSRDGNFLKSMNRFIDLVKELPNNGATDLARVGGLVKESAQLDIDTSIARVEKALKLSPGNTMSYVGAGNDRDYINFALSKVGPEGRVVGEDIDLRVIENLNAEFGSQSNFSSVLGSQIDPKLAAGGSDSVLAKSVFHEFTNPGAMLKGIWNALKPDGNLVILEQIGFQSERTSDQNQKANHHLSATKVRFELEKAGFEVVSVSPMSFFGQLQHQQVTDYMIVAKKCGAAE